MLSLQTDLSAQAPSQLVARPAALRDQLQATGSTDQIEEGGPSPLEGLGVSPSFLPLDRPQSGAKVSVSDLVALLAKLITDSASQRRQRNQLYKHESSDLAVEAKSWEADLIGQAAIGEAALSQMSGMVTCAGEGTFVKVSRGMNQAVNKSGVWQAYNSANEVRSLDNSTSGLLGISKQILNSQSAALGQIASSIADNFLEAKSADGSTIAQDGLLIQQMLEILPAAIQSDQVRKRTIINI